MIYRGRPGEAPFADDTLTTPPHDQPDQPAADYLPTGHGLGAAPGADDAGDRGRRATTRSTRPGSRPGKPPANAIWLWGQGKAPALPKFAELHGLKGAIISAVDLVRGVGLLAGWDRIDVPGATGYLDTDYAAKGRYGDRGPRRTTTSSASTSRPPTRPATRAGPTPRSRPSSGSTATSSARSRRALDGYGEWRILISPDHATLLRTRAHDRAWVPWAMAGTGPARRRADPYDEASARDAGGPLRPGISS